MSLSNLIHQIKTAWLPIPRSIYTPNRRPLIWETLPEPWGDSMAEEWMTRFTTSVNKSLRGVEKAGIWLSGGVDSSLLLATAHKLHPNLHAVTIDFGTYPDEVDRAEECAKRLGVPITIRYMTVEEHLSLLHAAVQRVRQTVDVATQVLVAGRICEDEGCDVVLSALGADELMAGYPVHVQCRDEDFPAVEAEYLEKCQAHFCYINSYSSTIPVRYPYLDPDFIGYSRGLPTSSKRSGRKTKILMRKAASGIIPDENRLHGLEAGTKYGFGPNFHKWWRGGLSEWAHWELMKVPARIKIRFLFELAADQLNKKIFTINRLASVPTLLETCGEVR